MNRYTVTWLKEVEGDLARLWIGAPDRHSVSAAADAIDADLAREAERKGTPVSEGLQSLYVSPLYVLFTVREADCLVEVVSIRPDRPLFVRLETNGAGPGSG
jgi:hypothetical protein